MGEPAVKSSPNLQHQGLTREVSRSQVLLRRFLKSKTAVIGIGVLLLLILMAIFAPLISPESWEHFDPVNKNKPPSARYWFGTDGFGRDLFSRIAWGARISLTVGFVAAAVGVVIGSAWGAVAGYYGGSWLDVTMMRIAEAVESIPFLILLVVISSLVPRSVYTAMFVIGITSWPSLAFLVRGQFLSLRQWDFVQAAQALGALDKRIIFRHILPNVVAIIVVSATLRVGGAILAESSLSFLGYGAPPPYPTWGETLASGRNVMREAPWVVVISGLFITATVLSFNWVGDGLRDALDPKMKR
jgi:peptide/nickel transport system permease protein